MCGLHKRTYFVFLAPSLLRDFPVRQRRAGKVVRRHHETWLLRQRRFSLDLRLARLPIFIQLALRFHPDAQFHYVCALPSSPTSWNGHLRELGARAKFRIKVIR